MWIILTYQVDKVIPRGPGAKTACSQFGGPGLRALEGEIDPAPPPGDLPNPGIEPASPALQADSLPLSHQGNLRH